MKYNEPKRVDGCECEEDNKLTQALCPVHGVHGEKKCTCPHSAYGYHGVDCTLKSPPDTKTDTKTDTDTCSCQCHRQPKTKSKYCDDCFVVHPSSPSPSEDLRVTSMSPTKEDSWEEEYEKEFAAYKAYGEFDMFKEFMSKHIQRREALARNEVRKRYTSEAHRVIDKYLAPYVDEELVTNLKAKL